MSAIKCIIFDCDGVLVDSEEIANKVLYEMSHTLGVNLSVDDLILNFSGRNLQECFRWIESKISVSLPSDFEVNYRKKTFERFEKELKPIDGIKEFINELTIPYCVASSGPLNKIRLNLSVTGLLHHFEDKIFSSYEIKSWKPDPDIFLHAAKQMNSAVQDCIVIEDSVAGVMAAVAGGFKVYGLSNSHTKLKLEEAGAITFNHISDLPHLLNL
jgi:HAD superfamily hydrolase (TIGR01509 family)